MDVARHMVRVLLEPFVQPVQRLRGLVADEPGFAVLLLLCLLTCAAWAIRGNRPAALVLVPLSFAWFVFNGTLEGPTLLTLSWSHGVTASDLISIAGLLIAAWRLAPVLVGVLTGRRRVRAADLAP